MCPRKHTASIFNAPPYGGLVFFPQVLWQINMRKKNEATGKRSISADLSACYMPWWRSTPSVGGQNVLSASWKGPITRYWPEARFDGRCMAPSSGDAFDVGYRPSMWGDIQSCRDGRTVSLCPEWSWEMIFLMPSQRMSSSRLRCSHQAKWASAIGCAPKQKPPQKKKKGGPFSWDPWCA